MHTRDFVNNLKLKMTSMPNGSSVKEELQLLCWGAADTTSSFSVEFLTPFIDVLYKNQHENETCLQLLTYLQPYLQAQSISPLTVWNLQSLVTVMAAYPVSERVNALASFHIEQLSKIILAGSDFRSLVKNQANYVGDEDHARTVLMAIGYYYYELIRTRTSDYKHITGSWTGYDKATKKKGINLALKFLESGDSLSNFEKFLDSEDCKNLKAAMLQGELGDFCKMITFASKPENRESVKPSSSWPRSLV